MMRMNFLMLKIQWSKRCLYLRFKEKLIRLFLVLRILQRMRKLKQRFMKLLMKKNLKMIVSFALALSKDIAKLLSNSSCTN